MSKLSLEPAPKPEADIRAEQAAAMITTLIEDSIKNAPRSLQKRIGPSEIGTDCDHCLAAKLAGWETVEPEIAWLPFIGTCVHEHYERLFTELNTIEERNTGTPAFLTERTVTVGQLDGVDITGSTDLYMPDQAGFAEQGMTVDWKIVGKTTLDEAKRLGRPSQRYIVQAMLYARGWNNAGYPTSHVSVYFQPRNAMSLRRDGFFWIAPYDERIALDALDRAQTILNTLHALEAISLEARDNWISSQPRASHCWDCPKYPDWQPRQPDGRADLDTLFSVAPATTQHNTER